MQRGGLRNERWLLGLLMAEKGVLVETGGGREGVTYGCDVQMHRADIGPRFGSDKLFFRERADWDVDNEAPALQIQSEGPCQGRMKRTSHDNDLCPGAVGCSACSSLLVI